LRKNTTLPDLKIYCLLTQIYKAKMSNLKEEIESTTIIFQQWTDNSDRSSRVKVHSRPNGPNKHLYNILFNSCRKPFSSPAKETFSRIDDMLGHSTNLRKVLKSKIIFGVFSDHNAIKLEINNMRNFRSYTWKLNKLLLNN
jgi:hypothetical protein